MQCGTKEGTSNAQSVPQKAETDGVKGDATSTHQACAKQREKRRCNGACHGMPPVHLRGKEEKALAPSLWPGLPLKASTPEVFIVAGANSKVTSEDIGMGGVSAATEFARDLTVPVPVVGDGAN